MAKDSAANPILFLSYLSIHSYYTRQFLSEEIFLSKPLALLLLALHLGTLTYYAVHWLKSCSIFTGKPLSPRYVCYTLLLSNFAGIVFSRTLHYQFYAWYFHAMPLCMWLSPTLPVPVRLVLWACMEYAFNVFPATSFSSGLLQVAHGVILMSLKTPEALGMQVFKDADASETKKKQQ